MPKHRMVAGYLIQHIVLKVPQIGQASFNPFSGDENGQMSGKRIAMRMRYRSRRMLLLLDLYRNHVQFTMPHPACSRDLVCKVFHANSCAAQNDDFEAVIMIHMDMHAG